MSNSGLIGIYAIKFEILGSLKAYLNQYAGLCEKLTYLLKEFILEAIFNNLSLFKWGCKIFFFGISRMELKGVQIVLLSD